MGGIAILLLFVKDWNRSVAKIIKFPRVLTAAEVRKAMILAIYGSPPPEMLAN